LKAGADINYLCIGDVMSYDGERPLIEELEDQLGLSQEELKVVMESLQKDKEIKAQIAKNKERLKNGSKLKGKSGVVIADEIAKRQISGEEKRVITPEVGKELRQEIMRELNAKKHQKE
jgi:DNA-binding Lrp family transcriptional regulator